MCELNGTALSASLTRPVISNKTTHPSGCSGHSVGPLSLFTNTVRTIKLRVTGG